VLVIVVETEVLEDEVLETLVLAARAVPAPAAVKTMQRTNTIVKARKVVRVT
jgi:hypothetical protein